MHLSAWIKRVKDIGLGNRVQLGGNWVSVWYQDESVSST
jgi:hypothetical protein